MYRTEAERLQSCFANAGLLVKTPTRCHNEEYFPPEEKTAKQRIPQSDLSDHERHAMRIKEAVVREEPNGEISILLMDGTKLSLTNTDYVFRHGDRLDILRDGSKYKIMGRKPERNEVNNNGNELSGIGENPKNSADE